MLSETEAGKLRVKSSEDRWVNAAVRRSDIIFAEAEPESREIPQNRGPGEENSIIKPCERADCPVRGAKQTAFCDKMMKLAPNSLVQ